MAIHCSLQAALCVNLSKGNGTGDTDLAHVIKAGQAGHGDVCADVALPARVAGEALHRSLLLPQFFLDALSSVHLFLLNQKADFERSMCAYHGCEGR